MPHVWHDAQAILPVYPPKRSYQPGKKTILVAVLLSLLLVMSQIFCSLHLNKPSKVSVSAMHEAFGLMNEVVEPPPCLKNFLGDTKPPMKPMNTCHHIIPPRGICSLISELFYDVNPATCSHQQYVEFCIKKNNEVKCKLPIQCGSMSLSIGEFDSRSGNLSWKRISFSFLEKEVLSCIRKTDYKGFLFIRCSIFTQLFIAPPSLAYKRVTAKKYIDINLVMIDSLSRNHFFRSLPKTVSFMSDLNENSFSNVDVMDFEYVQSVKQRTFESLQALFTGFVDLHHKPFGLYDIPSKHLALEVLLKKLKRKNFRTLWLEDLCWAWEWGLPKDLKVTNKTLTKPELYSRFRKALKRAHIDSVDLTLASCPILEHNERNDPFRNTPAICFNGKYHHEYILEYLQKYQQQNADENLFTFTQTNVAHDETGVRIQSLDKSLMNYLNFSSKLDNTLTILFSDHGNAYGQFIQQTSEAYVETFNPFLFFIIPLGVRKKMNDVEFRVFEENKKNLITLLDVHETILALVNETNSDRNVSFKDKYTIERGLLSNIPNERTCLDLPLIMPNLCICQNFDVVVPTSSLHISLVEFSIGILNNFIVKQRYKSGMRGFGKCQLLIHDKIRSTKEVRISSDVISYKFDVSVKGIMSEGSENFFFIVEVGAGDPSIRLISYERISMYGQFAECQDSGVELKLCICKPNKKQTSMGELLRSFLIPNWWLFGQSYDENSFQQVHEFLKFKPPSSEIVIDEIFPSKNPCLYILRHEYSGSFNIFAINLCSAIHKVSIMFSLTNVIISDDVDPKYIIRPLDVRLLVSGTKENQWVHTYWSQHIIIV